MHEEGGAEEHVSEETEEETLQVEQLPEDLTDIEAMINDTSADSLDEETARSNALADKAIHAAFDSLPHLPDSMVKADPLTIYMTRLRHLPILNATEQQRLAVRYREDGDGDAAKKLILSNLRLVVKIAREYQRRWTNLLELIQEGNVGLSEAIKRYDPYRNVKFTSYAQYWIRAMILNYLMNHFQPVRIGSTRAGRKLFYNLKKARAKLVREGFLNPSPALIAQELGVDERDVIDVSFHLDIPPLSLEANAPGYNDTTVGELLADRDAENPEDIVASGEFKYKIREAMDDFAESIQDTRDRALWFERMTADEPLTLAELGERFGVSKERIRQLEVRLKARFKRYIEERLGATLQLVFNDGSA